MSRAVPAAAIAICLAGCAVGPRFEPPAAPTVADYTAEPLPKQTVAAPVRDGEAQRLVAGMDVPADWWTLFRSTDLDALVAESLANNPTLRAAKAALRQARELREAQRGALFPTLQAQYSRTRQRDAVGTLSPTLASEEPLYNLHTAQVSVSYLLDLFGANRRRLESATALADAQRFELESAYLTLTSNVVAAAVDEASVREQLAATNDILLGEREVVQILRRQYEIGSIAQLDVMAQEAQLATTEATIPPLERQLAQQRDLLAALTGRLPSDMPPQTFLLSSLTLPLDLPVSVPANLVHQRPDVRAAEAQLHAATADVGVAISDLLPQFPIIATSGSTATEFPALFAAGNVFWVVGASLSETLFAGGALVHRKRAAEAALDEAGAQYRSVVLAAFENVADTLEALQFDAEAVSAAARAEQAAAQSLEATRHNVEIGTTSSLAFLNAEQIYNQARLGLATARANRYADTVALFQALGGGWWNVRKDANDDPIAGND
jgi:NodT family efflux transporter outer membrane factor (OMF) lipoprotein